MQNCLFKQPYRGINGKQPTLVRHPSLNLQWHLALWFAQVEGGVPKGTEGGQVETQSSNRWLKQMQKLKPSQNKANGRSKTGGKATQTKNSGCDACQPSKLSNADEAGNNNSLLQIPGWNLTEEMVTSRWVDMA